MVGLINMRDNILGFERVGIVSFVGIIIGITGIICTGSGSGSGSGSDSGSPIIGTCSGQ